MPVQFDSQEWTEGKKMNQLLLWTPALVNSPSREGLFPMGVGGALRSGSLG